MTGSSTYLCNHPKEYESLCMLSWNIFVRTRFPQPDSFDLQSQLLSILTSSLKLLSPTTIPSYFSLAWLVQLFFQVIVSHQSWEVSRSYLSFLLLFPTRIILVSSFNVRNNIFFSLYHIFLQASLERHYYLLTSLNGSTCWQKSKRLSI